MGQFPLFKTFTIFLFLTRYCESQPVEFIKEKIGITTICPDEELAKDDLHLSNGAANVENENLLLKNEDENNLRESGSASTDISDPSTTICPEDLERLKKEDDLNETIQHTQHEVAQETTTICPEELEKEKLVENKQNLKNTADNLEESNELFNTGEYTKELNNHSKETSTICPEEAEKLKLEKFEDNLDDISQGAAYNIDKENELLADELSQSNKIGTIRPEELDEKTKEDLNTLFGNKQGNLENNELDKTVGPIDGGSDESKETTICPEELEKKNQEKYKESLKINYPVNTVEYNANLDLFKDPLENSIDDLTNVSSKELARIKLEQSQRFLSKFKELVDKSQKRKTSRKRRQSADYTYFANQPTYNSQGLAVSNTNAGLNQQQSNYIPQAYNQQPQKSLNVNQNQHTYKPESYASQKFNPQPIKTYQQIRKQYQPANTFQKNASFYPKNSNSVKTYRNPSTFVNRYPSNGSFKNYYRLNHVGNRRQFQGVRPFTSTTARPNVRITRKKKFKPSPVFA